jgi:hypothetical protein
MLFGARRRAQITVSPIFSFNPTEFTALVETEPSFWVATFLSVAAISFLWELALTIMAGMTLSFYLTDCVIAREGARLMLMDPQVTKRLENRIEATNSCLRQIVGVKMRSSRVLAALNEGLSKQGHDVVCAIEMGVRVIQRADQSLLRLDVTSYPHLIRTTAAFLRNVRKPLLEHYGLDPRNIRMTDADYTSVAQMMSSGAPLDSVEARVGEYLALKRVTAVGGRARP